MTVTRAASSRGPPQPWVQANRKVPRSKSRATTAAPANAPVLTGTSRTSIGTRPIQVPKMRLNWARLAAHGGLRFRC